MDFARANDAIIGSSAYARLLVARATALVAGRTVTGDLREGDGVGRSPGYYDEWTDSATVGQQVVVTMDSDDVDPYLVVLQDDGTEVASDDDGGVGNHARVEFRAPATARYTIIATSFLSEETGRYTIRVEQPAGGDGADDDGCGTGRDLARVHVLPGNGDGYRREIHDGFAGEAE